MSSTLSYSLGAGDISKIVDALLPKLARYLPKGTKDDKYASLHIMVNKFSQGKTYSDNSDLDRLVKDIVTLIIQELIQNFQVSPNDGCNIYEVLAGDTCTDICKDSTCCNDYYYRYVTGAGFLSTPYNCFWDGLTCVLSGDKC